MTPAASAPARTLAHWFRGGLEAAAGRVALRVGEQAWTYEQVHADAARWASTLRELCPDGPRAVGVLGARSHEVYVGMLAALYAGAAIVPIGPVFPPERTATILRDAGVDALVVDRAGAAVLPRIPTGGIPVLAPHVDGAGTRPGGRALPEPVPVGADDVAYALFTSGSTGRPKGVPVTHRNMDRFLAHNRRRYDVGPEDVFSQTFDTTFDLAMFDVFMAWGAGATLVSTPPQAFLDLPGFLARTGVTVWFSVPSAVGLVRRRGGLTPGAMPGLRWSLFCGEPLARGDAADWQVAAPGSAVENLYGPTELTIACSAHRFRASAPDEVFVGGTVPLGPVYPHLDHVLRADDGTLGGARGELCVTGEQMFPGYLDPADDDGRFLDHDGRRWYRTGDVVRESAVGLHFLGRADQQVKIRGYRVEPSEVEQVLRGLPGVGDVAVVPYDSGGGKRALAAFVTGEPEPWARVVAGLARVLPEFMVPTVFARLDRLPLDGRGKTDRRALTARAGAEPAAQEGT